MAERTMWQRAVSALESTWQAIGSDSLQCMVDCGEVDSIDEAVMDRDDVIDMVSSCGFKYGYPMTYGGDKEAVEWLEVQPQEVQDSILMEAFPHEQYGM